MCEMLVRVVDKVNTDSPELDAQCLKRGDVVVVCEDGWDWSVVEKSHSDWRIFKIPGMTVNSGNAFMSGEPGDPLTNPLLQARGVSMNLDHSAIPENVKNNILDANRSEPFIVLPLALINTIRTIRKTKSPLINKNIIG